MVVVQQPTAGYSIEIRLYNRIQFSTKLQQIRYLHHSQERLLRVLTLQITLQMSLLQMVQQPHSHYQKQSQSSNDLLVTLDGVTQYPNTQSTTRAYSVLENVLTFTSAPAAGVIIQARHIWIWWCKQSVCYRILWSNW